jgi:hypothetical protein
MLEVGDRERGRYSFKLLYGTLVIATRVVSYRSSSLHDQSSVNFGSPLQHPEDSVGFGPKGDTPIVTTVTPLINLGERFAAPNVPH